MKSKRMLYIAIFDEAEIGLLVVGLAYTKMRWLIKGPSVVGKDMENFKNITMDTVSG